MNKREVREHPIIFSPPMVEAILDGKKTQTRRILKPQPISVAYLIGYPYGRAGDKLWVKEHYDEKLKDYYRAQLKKLPAAVFYADKYMKKWKSPIFMPRWASRITLEVTDIKVQRLQDITDEDARKEGCEDRRVYSILWNELNLKRGYGWNRNPWVWVISFKRED